MTITFFRPRRWGDHDRYFGPFTFAKNQPGYRSFTFELASGCDDYPGANLRLSLWRWTMIVALPQWVLRPAGDDERRLGWTLSEGHLSLHYGRQTNDSSSEKQWGWFLPWTQWRYIRRSFYDENDEHVATILNKGPSYKQDPGRWERERGIKDAVPTMSFHFDDYDGERIIATTRIEEAEWRLGTGWFKWLSIFCKPRIVRSLDLQFTAEVGPEKGSWKGGTLGHGITMLDHELHADAFKRYCAENRMVYRGPAA